MEHHPKLAPKCAAYGHPDHVDLRKRYPQRAGYAGPDVEDALCRGPNGYAARDIHLCDHYVRLHIGLMHPGHLVGAFHHHIRLLKRTRHISIACVRLSRYVVQNPAVGRGHRLSPLVHQGRTGLYRLHHIEHGRQNLNLHLDKPHRVLRKVGIRSGHHGDSIPLIARLVRREEDPCHLRPVRRVVDR